VARQDGECIANEEKSITNSLPLGEAWDGSAPSSKARTEVSFESDSISLLKDLMSRDRPQSESHSSDDL